MFTNIFLLFTIRWIKWKSTKPYLPHIICLVYFSLSLVSTTGNDSNELFHLTKEKERFLCYYKRYFRFKTIVFSVFFLMKKTIKQKKFKKKKTRREWKYSSYIIVANCWNRKKKRTTSVINCLHTLIRAQRLRKHPENWTQIHRFSQAIWSKTWCAHTQIKEKTCLTMWV